MSMDLGKGFNFSVGGNGVSSTQLFSCAVVIGLIILAAGIFTFISIARLRREMRSEFSVLNDKIDSIQKLLKDVE